MVDVVRGEGLASGKAFPTSLLLGSDCLSAVNEEMLRQREMQAEWEEVTKSTDFS